MPDPTTYNRLRGLVLSASELKALSDWPDALVEDYLNIFDNLITLAGLIDIEIDQKLEEVPTDFSDGSIPFVNATTGFLVEDNANLFWDDALNILNAKDIIVTDLTPSLGVYTDASSQLTSTAPLVGILGHWTRTSPNLSPSNTNDNLTLGTGNVTTTGDGQFGGVIFDPLNPSATGVEGLVNWNPTEYALNVDTGLGPVLQVGQEMYVMVHNATGSAILDGTAVYPVGVVGGFPSVEEADAATFETISGTIVVTTMDIPNGTAGIAATMIGKVRDIDTSGLGTSGLLYIAASGTGILNNITNVRPAFPNYAIQLGAVSVDHASTGVIQLAISGDARDTFNNSWNGVIRESFNFRVTTTGTPADTIVGTLTAAGGQTDLTLLFSSGFSLLDVTSETITLTPGTDAAPVTNYVYILESAPTTLDHSISEWPTTVEHIRVAQVLLQTAATTEEEGTLRNQNWNDHVQGTTNQGHQSHLGQKLRQFEAQWDSGALGTVTDAGGLIYVQSTAGSIFQMHPQTWAQQDMTQYAIDAVGANTFTHNGADITATFPAGKLMHVEGSTGNDGLYNVVSSVFGANTVITVVETLPSAIADGTMGDNIFIVNDSVAAYDHVTDLSDLTLDASGGTLLNKSFSIVVWGSANKTGEPDHLFANLPLGTYLQPFPDTAVQDADGYSVYTIPKAFQGTGFLIARFTFQVTAPGVWSHYETQDLRGFIPNTTAGSGAGASGVTTFLGLTDTPGAYIASNIAMANAGATALEFNGLASLVAGTASEIDVADDGDGTITIGLVNPLIVGKGGSGAATFTDGSILLGSGAGAFTALGVAGNGEIPIGDGAGDPVLATITGTASEIDVTNGAGTITIGLVDPVDVTKGGSGAATFTDHGILLGSGASAFTALGAATDGQIPIGSTGIDPVLATITGTANEIDVTNAGGSITIGIVNPLIVGKGGSGAATFTDHGILLGSGTGAFTPLGVASNGQIPIGSAGVDPVLTTITQSSANQVVVTNGAGSITLSTPQDIQSGATPTFTGTNFTGIPEGGLSLIDVATNDSAAGQHGFLKKLDGVATNFMDGTGNWSAPAGGAGTVTSIAVGVGMDFASPIETTGTITMGTPGQITTATTDQATGTTHYHSLSAAIKTSLGDADSALQPGDETITGVSNADVITLAIGSQNISATLDNTAVTPASYTNTDLTVDADGRITAASNGAGGSGLWTDGGAYLSPTTGGDEVRAISYSAIGAADTLINAPTDQGVTVKLGKNDGNSIFSVTDSDDVAGLALTDDGQLTTLGYTDPAFGNNDVVFTDGSGVLTTTAITSGDGVYWNRTGTVLTSVAADDDVHIQGHASVGTFAPFSNALMQLSDPLTTTGTGSNYGILCQPEFAPASANTGINSGIGGFSIPNNNNITGSKGGSAGFASGINGLNFAVQCITSDRTISDGAGIAIAGALCVGVFSPTAQRVLTADNIWGGYFIGFSQALNGNLTTTNLFGIEIPDSDAASSTGHNIDNQYGMLIRKPTRATVATDNYQLVLEGAGDGSGLFMGGTVGAASYTGDARIYMTSANNMVVSIAGTDEFYIGTYGIAASGYYSADFSQGIGGDAGTTYTFGGGGSGDIASMTFKNGLLTAVTTV